MTRKRLRREIHRSARSIAQAEAMLRALLNGRAQTVMYTHLHTFLTVKREDVMTLEDRNRIRRQIGAPEYEIEPHSLGTIPPELRDANDSVDPAQRAYDNVLSLGGTKEDAERAYDQVRRTLLK